MLVVGSLIGAATVQAVPKINGRLASVNVHLGDPVRRGQMVAKVEDREIQEQVRQAEASYQVAEATIRQRQADLKLAQTNLERNKSLLDRQLLPKQTYDDTDARHQASEAQLDLAKAQFEQAKSRLEELKINLSNTVISSPVDGFVGKRFLDPGASVSPNVPVASIVDIRSVRMVANLVEKDVKRVTVGTQADVEVDAFPGEVFKGRVSRIAPVFDPATRTAEMEIEVPNPVYRLKPGMYARVQLTVSVRPARAHRSEQRRRDPFRQVGCVRRRPCGAGARRHAGSGERSREPGHRRERRTQREVHAGGDRHPRRRPHRDRRRPGRRHAGRHDRRRRAEGRRQDRRSQAGARSGQRRRRGRCTERERPMSIPRTAIQRPVTMFMLSA